MEAENLVENSRVMGDYLLGRLEELQTTPPSATYAAKACSAVWNW
jgi:4-aminobutyrate aminotransferase-like enzyme